MGVTDLTAWLLTDLSKKVYHWTSTLGRSELFERKVVEFKTSSDQGSISKKTLSTFRFLGSGEEKSP